MGDAKKRGSYEVRVAQAKEQHAKNEAEMKAQIDAMKAEAEAWWNGLSEEQKAEENKKEEKRQETMRLMRMAAGIRKH